MNWVWPDIQLWAPSLKSKFSGAAGGKKWEQKRMGREKEGRDFCNVSFQSPWNDLAANTQANNPPSFLAHTHTVLIPFISLNTGEKACSVPRICELRKRGRKHWKQPRCTVVLRNLTNTYLNFFDSSLISSAKQHRKRNVLGRGLGSTILVPGSSQDATFYEGILL